MDQEYNATEVFEFIGYIDKEQSKAVTASIIDKHKQKLKGEGFKDH